MSTDPSATGDRDDPAASLPPAAEVLVEALLELARSAAEDELSELLATVANTILVTTEYRTAVLNVYRPAWDDYEAVLVAGGQESGQLLLGSTAPRTVIDRLVALGAEILPGVHLLNGQNEVWDELDHFYTPELSTSPDPGAWQPDDALLVMLTDAAGDPLGFVSVDEPASGTRPGPAEVRLLRSVSSSAEQALRSAQRSRQSEDDKRLLDRLSRLSPRLSSCGSREELYAMLTLAFVDDLGFERAALYATADTRELVLGHSRGGDESRPAAGVLDRARLEPLLVPARGGSGCWLVRADQLSPAAPSPPRCSPRNGVGPLAWADHALVVPWYDEGQRLDGVLVAEDPIDHLRPSEQCRDAARLLVDLGASVRRSVEHRERLVAAATYDVLTGLRNRRGLHELIVASPSVAVLLCDIDHFKGVNDEHGHELGDSVLRRFGALLAGLAVGDDVAVRLGGEEFCIVLPNADEPYAVDLAERIRAATPEWTETPLSSGVTVSVGVAVSSRPVLDAQLLLAAADRGLYAAKRGGRDRVVVATDHTSGRRRTDGR